MIYFIQDTSVLNIKIGFTGAADAEDRLRQLQTGSPSGLILLATIPGEQKDEHALHERFKDARVHGEWFKPVPDLIRFMLDNRAYQACATTRLVCQQEQEGIPQEEPFPMFIKNHSMADKHYPWVMICPVCQFDCTHPEAAFTRVGNDLESTVYSGTEARGVHNGRRSSLVSVFSCESGHWWELEVFQHKGTNHVRIHVIPENEYPHYNEFRAAQQIKWLRDASEAQLRLAELAAQRARHQAVAHQLSTE